MQNILTKQAPHLRISHQSEVLILRQELATLQAEMKEIKQQMNQSNTTSRPRKITLSSNGQHHFIALDDILYCEADGSYTKVFIRQKNSTLTSAPLSQRIILISRTLKSMNNLISSSDFIRCHQSYLVNKKHVAGYESKNGLHLKLSDENIIPVSRRNKKEVLRMF